MTTTEENRVRAYISEITFNTDESMEIKENDIILFVGPNNAGKSQSLNDIYTKSGDDYSTTVIKNIKIHKDHGSLLPLIRSFTKMIDHGSYYSFTINHRGYRFIKETADRNFHNLPTYGEYRELFVCKLNTENRLSICKPTEIVDRDQPRTNPIHVAAYDPGHAKWLSNSFHKAFGEDITANSLHGSMIPLCIGPMVKLENSYDNEIERQAAYAEILESYKQVHMQGDGIKSFTGILLYLMLDYYSTYLIDEPESFLHPPQARIMGQIIGQTLRENQQAFISTHSEELIKGLLDVCNDRLKIVRITREENNNFFSILDNQKIKDVFGDPLLKYSNIMSSLFHKTVVLCESDSDCRLYSLIENHLAQEENKYSETLFIHCGGKHRMARIASALLSLNIDVRLIPDIDVLNDQTVFRPIVETFGVVWDDIEKDYTILASNLHSPKERINRANARNDINRVFDASDNPVLTDKEIKEINGLVKKISKWEGIKQGGKQAIPAGDATNAFNRLDRVLRNHHIYLVLVGQLEGFVKEVGGHGPEWINRVLEDYPDLNDPVYHNIRGFIKSVGLSAQHQ